MRKFWLTVATLLPAVPSMLLFVSKSSADPISFTSAQVAYCDGFCGSIQPTFIPDGPDAVSYSFGTPASASFSRTSSLGSLRNLGVQSSMSIDNDHFSMYASASGTATAVGNVNLLQAYAFGQDLDYLTVNSGANSTGFINIPIHLTGSVNIGYTLTGTFGSDPVPASAAYADVESPLRM